MTLTGISTIVPVSEIFAMRYAERKKRNATEDADAEIGKLNPKEIEIGAEMNAA